MHQLLKGILKKLLLSLFLLHASLFAQENISLPEYIETYKHIAMAEMRESGIPASIKLAQAILESGFGNGELAVYANNHFGIKCHGWQGMTYYYDDDEPGECFRKYTDPVQSFLDHSEFLSTRPWYATLFELEPDDYVAWAHGLKEAGYATNPQYAHKLIRIINEHELDRFDRKAFDPGYLAAEHLYADRPDEKEKMLAEQTEDISPEEDQRRILIYNRIKYVIAGEGDTPRSLARELDMRPRQIINYNNLDGPEPFEAGQRVYLQPKRRKGGEAYHIVSQGDTMEEISQRYGIRIENLYRRNDMTYGMEPEPGQKILLQDYKGTFFQYLFRRP